ncbi:hypothetical protein ACIOHS_33055 [Streptomyces sp. NPDC088253]|uniref:hypothetical protein n=1 Tax=Streptomyces sp. NPDC088253 TaxID=3365846 RepID=UPI00381E3DD9
MTVLTASTRRRVWAWNVSTTPGPVRTGHAGPPSGRPVPRCGPPPSRGEGLLDEADRVLVRETLAPAPYRITDEDLTAWRKPIHTNHCLVHLVAYGAFVAVDRIESALPAGTATE